MAKEIAISFALGAALTSGFTGAFKSASLAARNVAASVREMEKSSTGKLGASLAREKGKIRTLASSLQEAKGTLAALKSQQAATGGGALMLARQISQAEAKVTSLNGALRSQIGKYKETAAAAATTAGSVGKLTREYGSLSGKIEKQKALGAAFGENRAAGQALAAQRGEMRGKLAATAAAAMTVAAPVALSVGFEDQMAKVGAVSKARKEDMASLTAQARQLGRDTSFSASQAAEGMQYLAMAGFKTNQVMAAMPGMLDLAAASGTDLGRTADIASNILSAFELKAENMGHVGDVLVAAFTSSNTTLESLGDTMKYVGPVAKDAGASIEDAVAMAGMLGNVGISGSQAGTASKAIYARLAAPPTEAANALAALNIQTKDAQGNLRAVPDLLEEITLKTASLGTADRAGVFSKVFGLEPMGAASALAKQAAQTIDENGNQIVDSMGRPTTALLRFTDSLKRASDDMDGKGGIARRVAAQMNDTTAGSLRMLRSAWEDAGISVGNLFLPAIRGAAAFLSRIANLISAFTERFPNLSKALAMATAAVLAITAATFFLGLGLNLAKTSLNSIKGAFLRLTASAVPATTATGAFGAAATGAGAGAKVLASGLRSVMAATGIGAVLVGLGYAISLLIDNWDEVVAAMRRAWNWVTTTWSQLGVFFTELGNNLLAIFDLTWDDIGAMADSAVQWVEDVWNGIGEFFTGLWNGVTGIFTAAWNNIAAAAFWVWDQISGVWNGAADFFSGIVDAIFGVFTGLFDWLKEKFSWVFKSIDAISGFIGSITGAVGDAWDKAFGEDGAKAAKAAAESSAAKAAGKGMKTGAKTPPPAYQPPKFTPVSRNVVDKALGRSSKGAGGKKAGAGRSSGGGARAAGGAGAAGGSGPVTVVTLGGDNSRPITTFIPAGASSGKTAAAAASSGGMVLPRAGGRKAPSVGKSQAQAPGQISITQNFDVMSDDPAAFRKVMESLRPDFEALVRRALEKLASDKRRTAYSQ